MDDRCSEPLPHNTPDCRPTTDLERLAAASMPTHCSKTAFSQMRQSAFAATNPAIPPQGSPAPEGPRHHGLPVPARSRPHSTGVTPLRVNTSVRGATIGRSPGPTQTTLDDFIHIRRFPTDLRKTRGVPIKSPRHTDRRRMALEQKKS
jgi:hypothetical protein